MMNNRDDYSGRCPQCGKELTVAAGQLACPACMMRLAMQPTPSEVAAPTLDVTQSVVLGVGSSDDIEFPDLVPDQAFGDYQIVGRLGHGGMGVVYEADHIPTSRRVALKVMGHSLEDRDSRARFLREGRLAASINHPNTVYVYGTDEIEGRPTISMELVRGGTLHQFVKANGPFQPKAAVDVILQVIDGMDAAYDAGILHRDIKPNNCFVDEDGHVKIGDFGLSITAVGRDLPAGSELAQTQTEITQVGTFLGTPAYASPEQLRGEPLDHRSDIYAIGVTMYYLVTGKVPFAADNMVQLLARVLDNAAPSLRDSGLETHTELDRVIAKCLKKAPGDRFASYDELRTALLPLSSRVPTPATLGSRTLAAVLDYLVLAIVLTPISLFLFSSQASVAQGEPFPGFSAVIASVFGISTQFFYFALSEWRYGKTLGKRLLGMQVVQAGGRPTLATAALRSLLFTIPPVLPGHIGRYALGDVLFSPVTSFGTFAVALLLGWAHYLILAGMFLTARARNGNAAIHDLITGTRVVEKMNIVIEKPRSDAGESFDRGSGTEKIGPYHVLQSLGRTDQGELLLGYDTTLLRRIWLHVRPSGASPLTSMQKNSSRPCVLRWLGGQAEPTQTWDAFEALSGWSIADEESKSLSWSTAKNVLRQLVDEFSASSQADDQTRSLSINQVWVTQTGQVKLLPFGMVDPSEGEKVRQPESSAELTTQLQSTDDSAWLSTLSNVASLFADRYRTTQSSSHAMSLSEAKLIGELQHASSLTSVTKTLSALLTKRPIRVSNRVAGMIAATLVLPMFTILSSVMMTVVVQQQEASMPEARELQEVLALTAQERGAGQPDKTLRLNALKTYAKANYEHLIHDDKVMLSVYGQILFAAHRTTLNEIDALPELSESEIESAEALVAEIRSSHDELPRLGNEFIGLGGGVFWATLTWLELIWVPSMVTGLLFRGGMILRLFGLAVVNKRGELASGLRVFIRMFATGSTPACVLILLWTWRGEVSALWPIETVQRFSAAGTVITVCLAIVIYRSRRRLFSDRFAGTYLVAR